MIGSFSLGQVGPNFAAYASARTAAFKLYAIIDKVPTIDIASPEGIKPAASTLKGTIEFRNVTFSYPSRPSEPVLVDFSCVIQVRGYRRDVMGHISGVRLGARCIFSPCLVSSTMTCMLSHSPLLINTLPSTPLIYHRAARPLPSWGSPAPERAPSCS